MNLRTVTIRTTGMMLIVTISVPTILVTGYLEQNGVVGTIFIITFLWLFTGSPLAISLVVARKLKSATVPNLILLISTIAYSIWYVFVFCRVFTDSDAQAGLGLLAIGIVALPAMIPAWVAALILNWFYATKTPDPGTSRCTG